jgi:hypothetical protein
MVQTAVLAPANSKVSVLAAEPKAGGGAHIRILRILIPPSRKAVVVADVATTHNPSKSDVSTGFAVDTAATAVHLKVCRSLRVEMNMGGLGIPTKSRDCAFAFFLRLRLCISPVDITGTKFEV